MSALAQAGYLKSAPPTPLSLPALASAASGQSVETRARSYLDANCAQCHQPGGTAQGSWDARFSTPLSLANIVNGPLATATTDPANRILVPGDATHSQLLARISGVTGSRMPPLASNERDLAAEFLLADWIAALAIPLPPSRLINLATRAEVGTGGNIVIAGFVIGSAAKTVLIRAVGPALTPLGVPGAVTKPVLTLLSGPNVIATNTGWNSASNAIQIRAAAASTGAFALPEGGADSAILITLPPGPYTAQVSGVNGATGVGLVEVYDAEPSSPGSARLINTAVRATVGTGGSVVIPGLVVGSGTTKTVLIRAIGPGLKDFGVTETLLAEPIITLFAGSQSYLSNTAWNSAANANEIRTAAAEVGAFALSEGGKDSAILAQLSPGPYTLQISGKDNGTGLALVEVYEVP